MSQNSSGKQYVKSDLSAHDIVKGKNTKSLQEMYAPKISKGQKNSIIPAVVLLFVFFAIIASNWWVRDKEKEIEHIGDTLYSVISNEDIRYSQKEAILMNMINIENKSLYRDIALFYLNDLYKDNKQYLEFKKLNNQVKFSSNPILLDLQKYFYYVSCLDPKFNIELPDLKKIDLKNVDLLNKEIKILYLLKNGDKERAKFLIKDILETGQYPNGINYYLYSLLMLTK